MLRWYPEIKTLTLEPKVGSSGRTLRLGPEVEPYSGTLGWDLNVRLVKQKSKKVW